MDKYSYTAAEYMSNIRVLLGGKMAEEMRYGDDKVTSGVSNVSYIYTYREMRMRANKPACRIWRELLT